MRPPSQTPLGPRRQRTRGDRTREDQAPGRALGDRPSSPGRRCRPGGAIGLLRSQRNRSALPGPRTDAVCRPRSHDHRAGQPGPARQPPARAGNDRRPGCRPAARGARRQPPAVYDRAGRLLPVAPRRQPPADVPRQGRPPPARRSRSRKARPPAAPCSSASTASRSPRCRSPTPSSRRSSSSPTWTGRSPSSLSRVGLSTPIRGRVPGPGARHRPGRPGPNPGLRRPSSGPRTRPLSGRHRTEPG